MVEVDDNSYTVEIYDSTESTFLCTCPVCLAAINASFLCTGGEHYLAAADAFVFVYSITDKATFDALNNLK